MTVVCPQRGDKRKLVAMAAENAEQGLNQRRLKWLSESDKVLRALVELQEALSLPELPDRIECYDISNTQGANSVGSMVVFESGRPKPAHYRRFQIKGVDGIDDYASMQEMLRRRFRRLAESRRQERAAETAAPAAAPVPSEAQGERLMDAEAPQQQRAQESFGQLPGLVVIDGGKGHLNAVQEVFLELGVTDIPLCSLAKREEEVFLPHMAEPVLLPRASQGLYLVQRIRDEAHRFAITYHRQRRSKAATRSALDDVPGVGPKRKRELLRRFGSLAGIRAATLEEIASVPGMSTLSARKLAEHLGGLVGEQLAAVTPGGWTRGSRPEDGKVAPHFSMDSVGPRRSACGSYPCNGAHTENVNSAMTAAIISEPNPTPRALSSMISSPPGMALCALSHRQRVQEAPASSWSSSRSWCMSCVSESSLAARALTARERPYAGGLWGAPGPGGLKVNLAPPAG